MAADRWRAPRHPKGGTTLEPTLLGAERRRRHPLKGELANGQKELVELSKRAKGMRGCRIASQRRGSSGVEDREGYVSRASRDAEPMAGALNQYGARHPGSRL